MCSWVLDICSYQLFAVNKLGVTPANLTAIVGQIVAGFIIDATGLFGSELTVGTFLYGKTKKEEHTGMVTSGSSFFVAFDDILLNRASSPRP